MRKWMAVALIGMISLSACAGADDPEEEGTSGATVAGESTSGGSREDPTEAAATGGPAAEDADAAFGEVFTYEDGMTVTVSQPEAFLPSATSVNGGEPEFVTFRVAVSNATTADVDPNEVFVTVRSGDGEGGEVRDPDGGITGPPAEAIGPGAEASWSLAFGVLDSTDLLVRVQRGIDAEPVTFGG